MVALVVAAAAASLTYVWNFDVFSHVACGRWMLENQRVLGFDPFTAKPASLHDEWINVHWGFQLLVAALHSVGGFAILSVLKSVLAALALLAFALPLRRHIPPAWLIASGLWMLWVMSERVRVRPEAVTLLFLMLTITILETVRRGGSARRLWWCSAILLVWVNVHGLYILGLFLIWSAVGGAFLDRARRRGALAGNLATQEALAAAVAATIAPLISPWPVRAALHPFLLWARVSGGAEFYTYGVGELGPLLRSNVAETVAAVLGHPAALLLVLSAGGAMAVHSVVARRAGTRATPIGHLLWLPGFAGLALLAKRNIGLLGPACGFLLAWHGGRALRLVAERRGVRPAVGSCAAAAMLLLSAAFTFGTATEWVPRWRGSKQRFGAGLQRENYNIDLAEYLRDLEADGNIFCQDFGNASVFLYYCPPRRRTWMDGRLEAHSAERFRRQHEYGNALLMQVSADRVDWPDSVRFIVVGHASPSTLAAVAQAHRYQLIRVGTAGACFAWTGWRPDRAPLRPETPLPAAANIGDFDRPLLRDGTIEGIAPARRRWVRCNATSLYDRLGRILLPLGEQRPATEPGTWTALQRRCTLLGTRYLTAAQTEGLAPPGAACTLLGEAHGQWAIQGGETASAAVPIDVHFARALYLYRQVDPKDLDRAQLWRFAVGRLRALMRASHFDVAETAIGEFLDALPASQRVNPPQVYMALRNAVAERIRKAQKVLFGEDLQGASILRRTEVLTRPSVGLTDRAIRELRGEPRLAAPARLVLADLLLRLGRTAEARAECQRLQLPQGERWKTELRSALCDWVEGKPYAAADALETIAIASGQPLVRYYQALVMEHLGRYDQARRAAAAAEKLTTDPILLREIRRLRDRLQPL
ncbi:MAG TPA: hypothetical protein VFJ30_13645 [Phycisphaerae bacterium]|nr:hypothetical protein [Phycisphaerae bacterium]